MVDYMSCGSIFPLGFFFQDAATNSDSKVDSNKFLDFIGLLQDFHAFEICVIAAIVLFLIDYFLPTDFPAHISYLLAGLAVFFGAPFALTVSLIAGIATWLVLAFLHRVWFHKFLTNAPGSELPPENTTDPLPTK